MNKDTEKIKRRYNRIAKIYDVTQFMMEKGKMGQWREMLWKEVNGKVLEIGVGTGKNIQHYPEDVTVTAIDFSEKMLVLAKEKAEQLNRIVEFTVMDAQNLEFEDETFDTVITTCVFCSVPDAVKGLKEIKRVCKKNGKIIMLEHVRSKKPIIGSIMDILNPIIVRIIGANINRDTVENLRKAGLRVVEETDLMMDIVKHIKCTKN